MRWFTPDDKAISHFIKYHVDSEGGEIASQDKAIQMFLPEGALTEPTVIQIRKIEENERPPVQEGVSMNFLGNAYDFRVENNVTFQHPVALKLTYDKEEYEALTQIQKDDLSIFFFDENTGNWIAVESFISSKDNSIFTFTNHFSIYIIGSLAFHIANNTIQYFANGIPFVKDETALALMSHNSWGIPVRWMEDGTSLGHFFATPASSSEYLGKYYGCEAGVKLQKTVGFEEYKDENTYDFIAIQEDFYYDRYLKSGWNTGCNKMMNSSPHLPPSVSANVFSKHNEIDRALQEV